MFGHGIYLLFSFDWTRNFLINIMLKCRINAEIYRSLLNIHITIIIDRKLSDAIEKAGRFDTF